MKKVEKKEYVIEMWEFGGFPQYDIVWAHNQSYIPFIDIDSYFVFRNEDSPLSLSYESYFVVDNIEYSSALQYVLAEKARFSFDKETELKILRNQSYSKLCEIGKKIIKDQQWIYVSHSVLLNANYYKFSQNIELKLYLLFKTCIKTIVYVNPSNNELGIKMNPDDINITKPLEWKGLNKLGFALMEVRDKIRRENSSKYQYINMKEV